MSKRTTGYPLPEITDPGETMAVCICIPKERTHIAAFWGALYQLTMWNSWMEDEEKRGKDVAQVWLRYFLSWDRNITDKSCEDCDMATCCGDRPFLTRINPDTGRPEKSYDGGVTWQPDAGDVQNAIPLYPPLVTEGGSKTKCDAATNASEHFNELIESTHNNLAAASTVFSLAQAVAEAALAVFIVIVSGGTLSPLVATLMAAIWAAAQGVFALGLEAYDDYWTADKKDAVLCAIYCNIGDDGQFTESQYQAFRAKVKSTLPASPALDIIMTSVNAGGARGLSQMASYGNAALADCSSCNCDNHVRLWQWDLVGVPVEIFPDEDGVYTATAGASLSGHYNIFIMPTSVYTETFVPCYMDINVISSSGLENFTSVNRCNDGIDDPLAHCLYGFLKRGAEGCSFTFSVAGTCTS